MNSGSFDGGLLNLTNWVGNAVMPILAALILAMGIYKYSRGYHIDPYIGGTMAALSVSGLLRLAEVFASQGSGTSQYWSAILSLARLYILQFLVSVKRAGDGCPGWAMRRMARAALPLHRHKNWATLKSTKHSAIKQIPDTRTAKSTRPNGK